MMRKPPKRDALQGILETLKVSHRYGLRNACLYRLRPLLPYKNIVQLRVGDVLDSSGAVLDVIHSGDWTLEVGSRLASDLTAYLEARYRRQDFTNFIFLRGSDYLFSTQKSSSFSTGWLAQLYTHLDRRFA